MTSPFLRCVSWVYLQPGCVYHVQLKAEGNDHIERALPHHRVIAVRHDILQRHRSMIASLIKNPLVLLRLPAFHLLRGEL